MAQATPFPRHIVLAAASICGVLLALAVHMLGARFGLDLGGCGVKILGVKILGATYQSERRSPGG